MSLSPGLYYMALAVEGGRVLCNPVTVHADGSATTLGTRFTPTWVETMTTYNRLKDCQEAAINHAKATGA